MCHTKIKVEDPQLHCHIFKNKHFQRYRNFFLTKPSVIFNHVVLNAVNLILLKTVKNYPINYLSRIFRTAIHTVSRIEKHLSTKTFNQNPNFILQLKVRNNQDCNQSSLRQYYTLTYKKYF